jgi:DNA-binding NarL/FixJ family response regulator
MINLTNISADIINGIFEKLHIPQEKRIDLFNLCKEDVQRQVNLATMMYIRAELKLRDQDIAILEGIRDGRTRRAIAADMCLSHRTVEFHISSIKDKLGVKTEAQMVIRAINLALISIEQNNPK